MSNFDENLAILFKNENLSTVSAQKLLGISKTQLGRYLSGFYEPTLKNALKICNYFQCSIDYLMGLDIEKNKFKNFKNPSFETFIDRYFSLLKKNNISHYKIAKELNINRNNLNYWRKNKSIPTLNILYKISNKLETSIEFLIGRTDTI